MLDRERASEQSQAARLRDTAMLKANNVIGKLPTPPPNFPPHVIGGGVVFAFVGWLLELKEMLLASSRVFSTKH
jgi:hypothetical protein